MTEVSFTVVPVIFGAATVAYILYLGVGARIITPEVSERDIALSASIWRTGLWFIVAVASNHSV